MIEHVIAPEWPWFSLGAESCSHSLQDRSDTASSWA